MRWTSLFLGSIVGVVLVAAPTAWGAGTTTTKTEVVAHLAKDKKNRAPSKKHPRAAKVDFTMEWGSSGDDFAGTLQSIKVLFPKGSVYNGGKFPKCAKSTLDFRGVEGCPKRSIMGHGTGTADADGNATHPKITVVNGGRDTVFFYTTMTNPALVQKAVVGHIKKRSGTWAYELTTEVPPELQIIAGIPIILQKMSIHAGYKDWLAMSRWPTAISVSTVLAQPHGVQP